MRVCCLNCGSYFETIGPTQQMCTKACRNAYTVKQKNQRWASVDVKRQKGWMKEWNVKSNSDSNQIREWQSYDRQYVSG